MMAHRPRAATGPAAALLATLLAAACGGPPLDADAPGGRLRVVATTTIVADLVREIGRDRVDVVSLMGPGVDPHLYKPSEGDIGRMAAAQAVVYTGLHLEGKMTDVFERMEARGVPTLAVADCIPEEQLIEASGFSGIHDPHVWFDVSLWQRAAECARDRLAELRPADRGAFAANAATYIARLAELDDEVRRSLLEIPPERRVLVTAHDAFGYFGRAYDVEVRGLLGVSTASEAGTADVQQLARFIAERRIPAIFVESSVPSRYVEALQQAVRARGFDVVIGGSLYSDALGAEGTPAESYVGTVRSNVATIVGALR